jgi:hypothetical protein
MPETKVLKTKWFFKLDEAHQTKVLNSMLSLCTPLRDEGELLGALEEAETFTLTRDETKRLIAFRVGDISCPTEEDPSNPAGGRKRRSRVKKQTRRTQRKRRNTVRR